MDPMRRLIETVKGGEELEVKLLVERMLEEGVAPTDILYEGLLPAMDELGADFRNNEIFIAEVLKAGQAWNQGCATLRTVLVDGSAEPLGRVLIATVEGDMHDIGKNLVSVFMDSVGFEVIDLGVDVTPDMVVDAVRTHKPDILAMSALLTVTMKNQELVIKALQQAGLREGLTIFVGGAPLTREFCKEIGADYFESDAVAAAKLAQKLFGKRRKGTARK
ncbi:MAG: corrinoid protein [Clostridiales Family XIII bacterium]|jgi:5-methyltetrahydrofolate--homocysteine methyltransferase|nr:corrinoid protein [Clostridiales Family XIII bacterium]